MFIRILAVLLISLMPGCAFNRAASSRMLDERAKYGEAPPDLELTEGGLDEFRNHPIPVRTREKVSAVWIHRTETASHDYFWGGWISLVTDVPQWVLNKKNGLPKADAIRPIRARKKEKDVSN